MDNPQPNQNEAVRSATSNDHSIVTEDKPKPSSSITFNHYHNTSCLLSATNSLSASFIDDPVLRWMTTNHSSGSLISDDSYRALFFEIVVRFAIAAKSTVSNIGGDWGCVGILAPPGQQVGTLAQHIAQLHRIIHLLFRSGIRRTRNMLSYAQIIEPLKRSTFSPNSTIPSSSHSHYYINFIGTLPSTRGQGRASAWIREYCQPLARNHRDPVTGKVEPRPIWLESSSENSRRLYERCGFETVGEVRFGVGGVDELGFGEGEVREERKCGEERKDGKIEVDDEMRLNGVPVWGMVWWPDRETRERYGNGRR